MHRSEPTPTIRGLTRVEIVLPDEIYAAIERAARSQHTTFVEMLRRCVDHTLGATSAAGRPGPGSPPVA